MAKVVGSVDDRGRPVVRLEIGAESLLMAVDTGFNGDLLLSLPAARLIGLPTLGGFAEIELGDGRSTEVSEHTLQIDWLSEQRATRTFVAAKWQPRADDPAGLVRTGLLSPHLLLIDFGTRLVEIETQ